MVSRWEGRLCSRGLGDILWFHSCLTLGICPHCPELLEHEVLAGLSQALRSSKVLQTGGSSMWGCDAYSGP